MDLLPVSSRVYYVGSMDYKKQSHSVYICDYHLVLPTKYRREIFNEGIFAFFKLKLEEINKHYPQIQFKEFNHDTDHIHLLVSIPPSMSVGSAIRIIKTNTAIGLKQKFPFLKEAYWGTDGIWSDGYFVSTVGINESIVRKYIIQQGKEDTGQAKLALWPSPWYPGRKPVGVSFFCLEQKININKPLFKLGNN